MTQPSTPSSSSRLDAMLGNTPQTPKNTETSDIPEASSDTTNVTAASNAEETPPLQAQKPDFTPEPSITPASNKAPSVLEHGLISLDDVENGSYFSEAQRWYDTLYIRPIHERVYFLVCSILAITTAFFGIIALNGLLPLKSEEPFLFLNREYNTIPVTSRLRNVSEDMNSVLIRALTSEFVRYHESYSEEKYISNQRFIRNYGSADVYRRYKRYIDPQNPRSPLVRYQKNYKLHVSIDSVSFTQEGSLYSATVYFTETLHGRTNNSTQTYQAQLRFEYEPWDESAKEIVDPETGHIQLDLEQVQFKVVDYEVRTRVQ